MKLGVLLSKLFLSATIKPQYFIRVDGTALFFDYFIPSAGIAFEYDGRQHTVYRRWWHKSKAGFERAKARDELKEEWCQANNVVLVRMKHTDKVTMRVLRKLVLKALVNKEKTRP